ncbi:MAG: O-antigen ligase family protein [Chloroflexota bacterium]|nr:O-antigen ligase family protein [Chloroflexota bacterium]PLS79892.1 MAG: hypothetical protein CYG59_10830 [Chloroflexota bacterium]
MLARWIAIRSEVAITVAIICIATSAGVLLAGTKYGPLLTLGGLVLLSGIGFLWWRPILSLYGFVIFWPVYPVLNKLIFGGSTVVAYRLWQEVLIVITLGIVSVQRLSRRDRPFRPNKLDWSVMMLLLTSVYGSILAGDINLILYGFHLTYMPMFMYVLLRFLPINVQEIKNWIITLLVVSLIIGLLGIFFQFTDPLYYYSIFVSAEDFGVIARLGRWRMSSIFGNPLYFGTLMALSGTLSLALLFRCSRRFKPVWLGLCAVFAACTWWSITRGAWAMLIAGTAIIFWGHFRQRFERIGTWLIGVAMCLVLLAFAVNKFPEHFGYYLSDSSGFLLASRNDQWIETWRAISEAPLGHGIGVGHAQRRAGSDSSLAIYDGWYLKVAAENGVLGLLTFLSFMACAIGTLIKRVQRAGTADEYWLNLGILGLFVGVSLSAVGSNVWDYYMLPSVLWTLLGAVVTIGDNQKELQPVAQFHTSDHGVLR